MSRWARIAEGHVQVYPPDLTRSTNELLRFQARFDETFIFLAEQLRNLSLQMDALFERTELLRAGERMDFVAASVLTTREMVEAFKREMAGFTVLNEQVFQFSERMSSASAQLISTARGIGGVNRTLRVAAINVRLSASKLEVGGGSLAALTRELTGLASLSGERASKVVSITEDVGRRVNSIQLTRSDIDEASLVSEREAHGSLSDIFSALDTLFGDLTQVVTQASMVRNTISHAIVFMQRQDILRQGLDHIRLVLEEVEREYLSTAEAHNAGTPESRERMCAYVVLSQEIGELGSGLLGRSQAELDGLMAELRHALQVLRDSTELLAQTKAMLDGDLPQRLSAPALALAHIGSVLERRLTLTMECGKVITELHDPLLALDELFTNLSSVDHSLRNIVVMMRIEMPRLHGLDDPAGLIRGVSSCHTQFVEHLGLTAEPLTLFRGTMLDMRRTLSVIEKQHERIRDLIGKLNMQSQKIVEAGEIFFTRFHEVVNIGNAVLSTAGRCSDSLDRFTVSLAALRDARAACDRLASNAHEARVALERAGYFVDVRDETLAKLRDMVARFTVFADKEIAAETTGVAVEAGDESGTLTMF